MLLGEVADEEERMFSNVALLAVAATRARDLAAAVDPTGAVALLPFPCPLLSRASTLITSIAAE